MANKTKVKFIDTSHEVKQTMVKLSKSALNASAKVVRQILRENLPTRSKRLKNHIASWARIDYKTGQPELQIGFQSWQRVKKRGKKPSHANPHWIEFGVSPHQITSDKVMQYSDTFFGKNVSHSGVRGTHILRNTVYNNIEEIRAAQAEYLAELNKTIEEVEDD